MKITKKAYAKINFNLHVLPERLPNGYHQFKFLNQEATLADLITLEGIDHGIKFTCDNPKLSVDSNNLAYRAIEIVMKKYHPKGGIKIHLEKYIPITGGLGGGSSDAAAVILGLNELWNLKLDHKQKIDLADMLGKDVCYSVIGGTCMVLGAGEIIKPQNFSFPGINLIIVSPRKQKPSTTWAFTILDLKKVSSQLDKLDKLISAMKRKDLAGIAGNLHNDFEVPIIKHFPVVAKIKAEMMTQGAMGTNLSGAGLSVFGIWKDQKLAQKAFEKLKKIYPQTYLCQTI
jgi:4-diphosphocytidyl-2-C-methyl-D-erythritol kinase